MSRQALSALYPRAFVTGVSSGLGHAFAHSLLSEGVEVWGTSRDLSRLSSFASHPGFHPVLLDLASSAAAESSFLAASEAAGGSFDLVVMNAGYGVFSSFEGADFSLWQRQLEDMVVGTARLSHAALASMATRSQGCLVHVSSIAAELPIPGMAAYNMAKAALSSLSETLMLECAGTGVRIIDFRPGDHRTAFNRSMQAGSVRSDPRLVRIWARLEETLAASPPPERAAVDLCGALRSRRSGVVRSGSVFQSTIAPFFMAIAPQSFRRWALARYFDCR